MSVISPYLIRVIKCFLSILLTIAGVARADQVWLDELNIHEMSQDWGSPQAKKSVDGHRLKIGSREFERGVGTHANSSMLIELNGAAEVFDASIGIDGEMGGRGSVVFRVVGDGRTLFESDVLRGRAEPRVLHVQLERVKRVELIVGDGGDDIDYDHADWADARITLVPGATTRPRVISAISNEQPKIASTAAVPQPQIHGPRVVGTTPGRPFLFLVPATGKAPLEFSADALPDGLAIDRKTGVISGTTKSAGESRVALHVKNSSDETSRDLRIVAGEHKLALTPPMGWNSWNVWGTTVDAAKIRGAADAFVQTGLAAHGYSFINIDDAWEGTRDDAGNIRTNEKFGDMKQLADYVHGKGLKLGIYSSPGPKTCAGFEGSFDHEQQDANSWASWGIDYIKYDWCSCKSKDPIAPYALLRRALDQTDRDIVFSLCQYGMADVWKWASRDDPAQYVGGNLWRTTGDITDTWSSLSKIGFSQPRLSSFASPGHWNDPDMLIVGNLGWGEHPRPTRLKPIEQQTHITIWCMLSAPLLIGCDLGKLDDFTRDLLCNDEVLEIDQDPLAKPASVVRKDGDIEIWSRPLWDGTQALAVFNRGMNESSTKITWKDLARNDREPVRNLWRHSDYPGTREGIDVILPAHGSVLFKVGKPR